MTDRPNVLLIVCDQLRADALGCYGSPVVETPNIDALAADGVVFDSAYTPSPVCVPARASLISGLEPHETECYDNLDAMPDSPTFMQELTNAGYRTHGIGKMHFTPDRNARRGFETRARGEEFGSVDNDEYLAFVADNGYEYVERPHGQRDEMYYVPQLSPVPEELHHTRWVADETIRFLDSDHAGRPFFAWAGFIAPHPPFAPPSPWHRMYEPSLMPDPFDCDGRDGLLTGYDAVQNRYKYRDGGWDRRLVQLIRAYYAASVSFLDAQIGRIRDHLRATGQLDDTLIILTADHGEFLGDYRSFGKRSFLDVSARVPLIAAGPGFDSGRRREPVSLIDIFPTLRQAAQTGATSALSGRSLMSTDSRPAIFGQFQRADLGLYAVITDDSKYIYSEFDRREYLLDRVRDPHETQNLAYNPRVRDTIAQMRRLATEHFPDLSGVDIAARASNGRLLLGHPPTPETVASYRALEMDRDGATVVMGDPKWTPPAASR